MKTIEEFRKFYESVMVPELWALEEKRKSLYQRMIIIDVLIVFIVIMIAVFMISNTPPLFCHCTVFGLFLIIGLILTNHHCHLKTSGYYTEFKKSVINRIVTFFDDRFRYFSSEFISRKDFIDSRIFKDTPYPSIYKGDDFVTGKRGNSEIRFSEINASYTTGSGKSKHTHIIFKGLFFVATFDKNFNDEIVMSISDEANISGNYLPINTLNDLKEFRKRKNIRISFMKNKLYIAIPFINDLFEPKMNKSLLDFNEFLEYFECLNFTIATAEEMFANSGVWDPVEQEQLIQKESSPVLEENPYSIGLDNSYDNNIICPSCNTSVPTGNKFCINCGNKL